MKNSPACDTKNLTCPQSPTPSIGVGGLLFNRKRQILLIKRNQAPAQGFWSIPGGKQEPGETLIETCRREFMEETALPIDVRHIVAVVERRLEGFHYVIIDFLVRLKCEDDIQPAANSDVSEVKWIDLTDLVHYPLVPGLADIIRATHRSLENSDQKGLYDANGSGSDFILQNDAINSE